MRVRAKSRKPLTCKALALCLRGNETAHREVWHRGQIENERDRDRTEIEIEIEIELIDR